MAHLLANGIPPHLLMWRRVREYAVPPSMIEKATARRAVGDWAGACAAPGPTSISICAPCATATATELATRLRADLRRLAPDLLRCTCPGSRPTAAATGPHAQPRPLRSPRPSAVHLVVRTPPARADAGQRMSLALWDGSRRGPAGTTRTRTPTGVSGSTCNRHLWDAVRSADLARRCPTAGPGHGADHGPGHGAATGLGLREHPGGSWAVECWAAEAEHLLRADGLLAALSRAPRRPDPDRVRTGRAGRRPRPHAASAARHAAAAGGRRSPGAAEAAVRVPPDLSCCGPA